MVPSSWQAWRTLHCIPSYLGVHSFFLCGSILSCLYLTITLGGSCLCPPTQCPIHLFLITLPLFYFRKMLLTLLIHMRRRHGWPPVLKLVSELDWQSECSLSTHLCSHRSEWFLDSKRDLVSRLDWFIGKNTSLFNGLVSAGKWVSHRAEFLLVCEVSVEKKGVNNGEKWSLVSRRWTAGFSHVWNQNS